MREIVRLERAEQLHSIAADVFDDPVSPQYLAAFLECPRHVMFLAIESGAVVGMVSGVEYFHPDKAPQMWINEVGVAKQARRQGVGRALTTAMINEAESRGCTYAWLGTSSDNKSGNACFSSVPNVDSTEPFMLYTWDFEED